MSELTDLDTQAAESIMRWTAAPFPPLWSGADGVWQPTINIEQAWQCLEVMNSYQGVCGVAVLSFFDKNENCWYVEVRVADKVGVTSVYTTGWNTAPEAIVRACLKAKEFLDAEKTKDETG